MCPDDFTRKAKLWSFIFTSFTDDDVNRLSTLPPCFTYTSFALCNDDTGKQFLQGFVRTDHRCYKSMLYRSIGDNVIYDIPERNEDVCYILTTIQLSSSPKEFGSAEKTRFEGYLKEIKEFKAAVNIGVTATDKLTKRYPKICLSYPLLVQKYLRVKELSAPLTPSLNASTSEPTKHDDAVNEWIKAGRPCKK